ncbi:MAG: MerR family transcriptional regulator [Thermodesulfovibrionales bacterium]|nr:MerR family transcriptional regulator [Thermodesulfovibrionales bacterium]
MVDKKEKRRFIENKSDIPLYTIGVVSELLGTTNQTLRLYEKHGLIKPSRKNKNRFYSENDIKWLFCIRELIHNKKISIEGIKKLLNYVPCWEITDCPEERKNNCLAYKDRMKPCWELSQMICRHSSKIRCDDCVIFLQKKTISKNPSNNNNNR